MQVDVYWNVRLRKFSIRSRGKVIGHANRVLIREPRYVVQAAGQAKVRETGHKEVHAFVRGHLEAWKGEETRAGRERYLYPLWTAEDDRYSRHAHIVGTDVVYNPIKDDTFMLRKPDSEGGYTFLPVSKGEMALLRKGIGRSLRNKPSVIDFDPMTMPEVLA